MRCLRPAVAVQAPSFAGARTSGRDRGLAFGALGGTLVAGDEAIMKFEADYRAALATVTGYPASGDVPDLRDGGGQIRTCMRASGGS